MRINKIMLQQNTSADVHRKSVLSITHRDFMAEYKVVEGNRLISPKLVIYI